jgi:hypothetical protein
MERGAFNNLLLAHAQVWGMFLSLIAMIGFIIIILLGYARLDPTTEKLAYTVLGVFLAKFGDQIGYLYNRQRPNEPGVVVTPEKPPDPKALPSPLPPTP